MKEHEIISKQEAGAFHFFQVKQLKTIPNAENSNCINKKDPPWGFPLITL